MSDICIYRGDAQLSITASRLEVGAKSPVLLDLLSSLNFCDGCKEPATLIFPQEDEGEDTLKEVFKRLSHFRRGRGFSILQNQSKFVLS